MQQSQNSKHEIIMAGLGGMGVLVAGQVITWAASKQYKFVTYTPSYGSARRGGNCECSVIFSNERIASPLLDQLQTAMIFDSAQFKAFETRVRPGGIVIAEKAGLVAKRTREDYRLIEFPGLETAASLGEGLMTNMIMVGFYVAITGALRLDIIESELNSRFKGNPKMLARNMAAFNRGLELGKTAKAAPAAA